jgi:FtsH-binding integral membrane protein
MDSGPPTIDYRSPSQDDPGAPPRRPVVLWVSASFVWLASSSFLVSAVLLFRETDPISASIPIFMFLLAALFAGIEFGAMFRHHGCALIITVIFTLPVLFSPAWILSMGDGRSLYWQDLLSPTASTCLCGMIAVVHYRWWRRLRLGGWREPLDS